jgi:hypothetical protein
MAKIDYKQNKFGDIVLADGRFVRLTQQAYVDNDAEGKAVWFARGHLSTENMDEETGPTVTVIWDSLGADEAEDDANWDEPRSINHYALGELVAT